MIENEFRDAGFCPVSSYHVDSSKKLVRFLSKSSLQVPIIPILQTDKYIQDHKIPRHSFSSKAMVQTFKSFSVLLQKANYRT